MRMTLKDKISTTTHSPTWYPNDRPYNDCHTHVWHYPKPKPHKLPINMEKLRPARLFTGVGKVLATYLLFKHNFWYKWWC